MNDSTNVIDSRAVFIRKMRTWFKYRLVGDPFSSGLLYAALHWIWAAGLIVIMFKDYNLNPLWFFLAYGVIFLFNGLTIFEHIWSKNDITEKFWRGFYYCVNNETSPLTLLQWLGGIGGFFVAATLGMFLTGFWFLASDDAYISQYTPNTGEVYVTDAHQFAFHIPLYQTINVWHTNLVTESYDVVALTGEDSYIQFDFQVEVALYGPVESIKVLTPVYGNESEYMAAVAERVPEVVSEYLNGQDLSLMRNFLELELDLGKNMPIEGNLAYWSGSVIIEDVHAHAPIKMP